MEGIENKDNKPENNEGMNYIIINIYIYRQIITFIYIIFNLPYIFVFFKKMKLTKCKQRIQLKEKNLM